MVIKGYKQPLVQEDMWELNKADRTASIDQVFQSFMQSDLAAARVRLQTELRKKREKKRAQEDTLENGLCNGLREGVSQDVLMMVSVCRETH